MLPEDTQARAAAKVKEQLHQTNVDNHFKPANPEDKKLEAEGHCLARQYESPLSHVYSHL